MDVNPIDGDAGSLCLANGVMGREALSLLIDISTSMSELTTQMSDKVCNIVRLEICCRYKNIGYWYESPSAWR
jgi:hypothetical protein